MLHLRAFEYDLHALLMNDINQGLADEKNTFEKKNTNV